MFGFKKNGLANMQAALNDVQSFLRMGKEGETIELYQQGVIPKTKTFIEYANTFESEGLSAYGGLLKYCHNALSVILTGTNEGQPPVPIVLHIGEKMAHVVIAMERVRNHEDFTEADLVMLKEAKNLAMQWLSHGRRDELVSAVDQIVADMDKEIEDNGLLVTLRVGVDVLKPLMAWETSVEQISSEKALA